MLTVILDTVRKWLIQDVRMGLRGLRRRAHLDLGWTLFGPLEDLQRMSGSDLIPCGVAVMAAFLSEQDSQPGDVMKAVRDAFFL